MIFMKYHVVLMLGVSLVSIVACTSGDPQSREATAQQQESVTHDAHTAHTTYTCPMHPQIVRDAPGQCPICGMDLVPVVTTGPKATEIRLNARQMQLANIMVAPVTAEAAGAPQYSPVLNARVTADQQATRTISARVAGRIERLRVKSVGQVIRATTPLYDLYSESLLIEQQEYLITVRQAEELGQHDTRYEALRRAAEQKLRLYGMTPSQIQALVRANTVQPRVTFVAPTSGTVTEITVQEGQYVEEGAPLYRVTDLGQLWVDADLYPGELTHVRVGDVAQVYVIGSDANVPMLGRVMFVSPEYEPGTQIRKLRVMLANPHRRFLPGMRATVSLEHAVGMAGNRMVSKVQSFMLPAAAVIRTASGAQVYVQTAPGTFQPRQVTVGAETGDQIAILDGIAVSDTIVISGAYLLYSETVLKKDVNPMAMEMP